MLQSPSQTAQQRGRKRCEQMTTEYLLGTCEVEFGHVNLEFEDGLWNCIIQVPIPNSDLGAYIKVWCKADNPTIALQDALETARARQKGLEVNK
jgi:hypothetical protein